MALCEMVQAKLELI